MDRGPSLSVNEINFPFKTAAGFRLHASEVNMVHFLFFHCHTLLDSISTPHPHVMYVFNYATGQPLVPQEPKRPFQPL